MALVTILIQSMVKPLLSRFVAGLVFLGAIGHVVILMPCRAPGPWRLRDVIGVSLTGKGMPEAQARAASSATA